MKQYVRARRIGGASILLALVLRLYTLGTPAGVTEYGETGQAVRFSPSLGDYVPNFAESFAAATEPAPIPSFTGEEAVTLTYFTTKRPDIAALLQKPLDWELKSPEPTVLILHTHGTESYTPSGEDYEESSRWRTTDENYNMLSIGAHLAELLNAAGICTLQERSLHDHPSYNGSYVSARKAMGALLEEYPTVRLVLDLHRDAAGEGSAQLRTLASVKGIPSAQLMLVVGTNHDAYRENLSLGLKLHTLLEQENPGITRPLQLRSQRFNQDLSPGALLIEIGAAGNTRAEALTATEALAQAIIALSGGSQ